MIYRCVILKDTSIVYNATDDFITQNNDNLNDFETNYKSQCKKITVMHEYDSTISYSDLKNLVNSDFSNVEMYENTYMYVLYYSA